MNIVKIAFQVLLGIIALVACFYIASGVHQVRYDCSLSEISPDFPPEVREQCRHRYLQEKR